MAREFNCPNCKKTTTQITVPGIEIPERHEGRHEEVNLLESLDFRVTVQDDGNVVAEPILQDEEDRMFWRHFDPRVLDPSGHAGGPFTVKDKVIAYVREALQEGDQVGECPHCAQSFDGVSGELSDEDLEFGDGEELDYEIEEEPKRLLP